jgi:hypothetical protein
VRVPAATQLASSATAGPRRSWAGRPAVVLRREAGEHRLVGATAPRSPQPAPAPRMTGMRIVVAGSSGFVGRRLCPALEDAGHTVVALTRHPDTYTGAGTPVRADVQDAASLDEALAGADAAYYLVHSLDSADFLRKDAEGRAPSRRPRAAPGCGASCTSAGSGDDADALSATCGAAGGGAAAGQRRGPGDDAAGRDHRRPRRHLLGDDPPARRAPAGNAHAALGAAPARSRSRRGRRALPRRRPRGSGRGLAQLRHRRPRGPAVRRDAAPGRRIEGASCSSSPSRCSRRACRRAGCRSSRASTCRPAARSSTA